MNYTKKQDGVTYVTNVTGITVGCIKYKDGYFHAKGTYFEVSMKSEANARECFQPPTERKKTINKHTHQINLYDEK